MRHYQDRVPRIASATKEHGGLISKETETGEIAVGFAKKERPKDLHPSQGDRSP